MERPLPLLGTSLCALAALAGSVELRARPRGRASRPESPQVFFFVGVEDSPARFLQQVWFDALSDGAPGSDPRESHHMLRFPDAWRCEPNWGSMIQGHDVLVNEFRALRENSTWSMAYPAPQAACKPPDVAWVQQAADHAGVKLHVILLQRELTDSLASSCSGGGRRDCQNQSMLLQRNAEALRSHIDHLDDDAAVACYEHFDEAAIRAGILSDFNVTGAHEILSPFDGQGRRSGTASLHQHIDATGLTKENDRLRQLCATLPKFTFSDFKSLLTSSSVEQTPAGTSSTVEAGFPQSLSRFDEPELRMGAEGEAGSDGPGSGSDNEGQEEASASGRPEEEDSKGEGGGEGSAGEDRQGELAGEGPAREPRAEEEKRDAGNGKETREPENEDEEREWEAEQDRQRASGTQPQPQPRNEEEEKLWEAEQERRRQQAH